MCCAKLLAGFAEFLMEKAFLLCGCKRLLMMYVFIYFGVLLF